MVVEPVDRQYGSIKQIRPDHVQRYLMAAKLFRGENVLDLACGCGYGSWLLHSAGNKVTAVDIAEEAIEYAEKHYKGPTYLRQRAEDTKGKYDALVSFETLEHLEDPLSVLNGIDAQAIICSVPNEEVSPFDPKKFDGDMYPHRRHYTPAQFRALIEEAGYSIKSMFSQRNKAGAIHPDTGGMFLIAYGSRLL